MQFKACFKKEMMHYTRSFKLFGEILTMALIFLMIVGTMLLFSSMGEMSQSVIDQYGEQTTSMTEEEKAEYGMIYSTEQMEMSFDVLKSMKTQGLVFSSFLDSVFQLFVIVSIFLMMGIAGKEQKQRAHIIPTTCGMSNTSFVLTKFLIYPISLALITFVSVFGGGLLIKLIFPKTEETGAYFKQLQSLTGIAPTVSVTGLLMCAIMAAAFVLFIISFQFMIGVSFGAPGIAAIFTIGFNVIAGTLLNAAELDKYQPFALSALAQNSQYYELQASDSVFVITMTVVITVLISVLFSLITLFALNAQKIKNQEDIPEF